MKNLKSQKTFHLINFKFEYGLKKSGIRFYKKYISDLKSDKEKLRKCYGKEILNYSLNDGRTKYFEKQVEEYLKKMRKKNI